MLFPEEHAPHLKKWIVKRLENTSDADPDVLADYVLALLRHDGDITDVRKLCEEEIPDFLKEDSPLFVNDVFETIASQSYLPGGPPPARRHSLVPTPDVTTQPPSSLYYDDSPMGSAPGHPPRFQNGSRKRGYNDWDDPNAQNGREAGFGGRALKQSRRGGRGGRMDDMNNFRGGAPAIPPYPPLGQPPPQGLPAPSTVRYFDPTALGPMFGMSLAAGHHMPEFLAHDRGHLPPKKRKMCRDWEKKGYCQRGSNCMFQHSNDPVYPPLPGGPFGGMQPLPQPSAAEEYDPANALMPDFLNGLNPIQGQPPLPHFGHQQRHRGGKHQNRQKKAPFSADGPVLDRTKSTIVVENIPEESFDEDQVKQFFSQFGNVLEVAMRPYKRLAIVKFDNWNAANAAYQSPKVIFDNRFVKVFWYKDEESTSPASAPGAKKSHPANGSSTVGHHDAGPEPEMDMEEFAKQQEEKQKAFEEKTKKREELERQREELEKRQKELIAKHLEEKAKLDAKLAGSNGVKPDDNEGDPKKPVTQTDALRAQLAALEAEARQMGIDPDAVDASAPWPARGSYGGRGRGGWRGAASPYTPRGRGSFRGRANVHAAYAAYSLDNRPKKVVLTGVDFRVSEKDETLRQYLFGIGEFTDIKTTPTSTEITFKDRKTAEKFFNSVLLLNKEIPGLDAPVELAWAGANGASTSAPTTPSVITARANMSTTTPTTFNSHIANLGPGGGAHGAGASANLNAKQKTTTPATTTEPNDHDEDDAANGTASSDKDVHILLERPPADQNEMDYEVADDGQWGY